MWPALGCQTKTATERPSMTRANSKPLSGQRRRTSPGDGKCDLAVWIKIVEEARKLYGDDAARAMWEKSSLPRIPPRKPNRMHKRNVIDLFISERCELRKGLRTRAKALYDAYTNWCELSGRSAVHQNSFGRMLSNSGLSKIKTDGHKVYLDISLSAPFCHSLKA